MKVVIDEIALRRLAAGDEVTLEAADGAEIRVVFADVGFAAMLKAIALAAAPGEFRTLLETVCTALARGEIRATPLPKPRLRRPAA